MSASVSPGNPQRPRTSNASIIQQTPVAEDAIPRSRSSMAHDGHVKDQLSMASLAAADRLRQGQEWKPIPNSSPKKSTSRLMGPASSNPADLTKEDLIVQNEFLKDLVHRLNVELNYFQSKYPNQSLSQEKSNINQLMGLTDKDPTPQWLIKAEYLNPLLVAYDSKMLELNEFTSKSQRDLKDTREKLKKILDENDKLYEELEALSKKQKLIGEGKSQKRRDELDFNEEERLELTKRMDLLSEENEILVQQQRAHMTEIDKLRQELVLKSKEVFQTNQETGLLRKNYQVLLDNDNVLKSNFNTLQEEYEKLSNLWKTLQNDHEQKEIELQRLVRENKVMHGNLMDHQKTLDDISRQNHDNARNTHNLKQHEKDYQQQIKSLELLVTDLKAKYERKIDEADRLAQENYELVQASRAIEKRIRGLEDKEIEAFQTVQKSIEKVEQVLLERDKAIALQHQADAEIQRLNDKFVQSQTRWREKADHEISNIRTLWQSEKKQWKIEENNSNLKISQLQQQIERAKREKRAAELELDRINAKPEKEQQRLSQLTEHLQAQVRALTRERDEAYASYQSFQLKASRDQNKVEKEKETLSCQMDEMYRRLRRVEKEYEDNKDEKVRMQNIITELEHSLRKAEESKTVSEKQSLAEVKSIQRKYEVERQNLERKLQDLQEQHGKVSRELQDVLGKQHILSDRWKEESKSTSEHYERMARDLHMKLKDTQNQLNQAKDELNRVSALKDELMRQVTEERKAQVKLHGYLRETENKLSEKSHEAERLVMKEADQMVEKRELHRQLDKVILERDRLQRELELGIGNYSMQPTAEEKRGNSGNKNIPSATTNNHEEVHLSIDDLNNTNTASVGDRDSAGDINEELPADSDLEDVRDVLQVSGGAQDNNYQYYGDFEDDDEADDDDDDVVEEKKLQNHIDRINEHLSLIVNQ